ncbi:MAG TPA: hypothetical protein VIG90_15470 [Pedomonas sp.]
MAGNASNVRRDKSGGDVLSILTGSKGTGAMPDGGHQPTPAFNLLVEAL